MKRLDAKTPLLVVVLGTACLFACTKGGEPSRAAERFYDSLAAGDFAAAKKEATPATAEMIQRIVDKNGPEALAAVGGRKAAEEVIMDDTAVVTFKNEDGSTSKVPLAKHEGVWKVDFATMIHNAARSRVPGLKDTPPPSP
ncbi:MAG: hypothetical protein AAF500_12155 [Myxococcota bacterium]